MRGGLAVVAVVLVAASCGRSAPGAVSLPAAPTGDCIGKGVVERGVDAPFGPTGSRAAAVYLPACYDANQQRRFPVVFLLHGAGTDASQWPAIGLATAADALISSGQIPPMIVVMPDGGPAMPDSLVRELVVGLVPWADRTFRTVADPADRAVGGISRGGRVALLAAAADPGLFAGVGGHSPAVGANDDAVAARLDMRAGPIRLDVGLHDGLRSGVEQFASRVRAAGGSMDLVEANGGHNRAYWRAHVVDYLRFYASLMS